MDLLIWALAVLALIVALDRALLWFEANGWINYRRRGLSRGGASYHMLQLHSIFEPGMREVMEVKVAQEQEEDESGAPPGAGRSPDLPCDDVLRARPPEADDT